MSIAKKLIKKLDKYREIPLSDLDIDKLMGFKANILRYGELKGVEDIDQILGRGDVCFLLYEWKPHYGHWTLISKHGNDIEFFNPYGGLPDAELENVPEDLKVELGEDHTYLTKLLVNCPYNISYNEFQFQKLDNQVKTCGRWCILRAQLKELDLYTFQKFFHDLYSDEIVTMLTT